MELVVLGILGVAAYFLPTIVAVIRGVPNLGSVIVLNLFLGWTLVGWVVSLAMATRSAPGPAATVSVVQQPPADRSAGQSV